MTSALTLPAKGLRCPACGAVDSYVTDSRLARGSVNRRHQCRGCGLRFGSIEIVKDTVFLESFEERADIEAALRSVVAAFEAMVPWVAPVIAARQLLDRLPPLVQDEEDENP